MVKRDKVRNLYCYTAAGNEAQYTNSQMRFIMIAPKGHNMIARGKTEGRSPWLRSCLHDFSPERAAQNRILLFDPFRAVISLRNIATRGCGLAPLPLAIGFRPLGAVIMNANCKKA